MEKVIIVKNLIKKYGPLSAVDNISFEVNRGEVFGLLGENGAGKTTTLEMIEGLRKPTAGRIEVLGTDVQKNLRKIKEQIGVQLQSSAYYDFLKLREILNLFASFYHKNQNPDDLLKMVGLESKVDQYVRNLSGGQKQRFSIIASLINDPEIIFLDEPTTGLDPVARRNLWEVITKIRAQGKTIVLTTHYMEEAEVLCDCIAIMDKGKIIALDETHKLIEKTEFPYRVEAICEKENPKACAEFAKIGQVSNLGGKKNNISVFLRSKESLAKAMKILDQYNIDTFSVGRSTLEDLFIELTGKTITDEENDNG
ncbi:MAG: ABC transporter ATP-binding protein [Patescibacteria group bacterium]|jgi:ABC-2 type transport system ATP-binding protein